MVTCVVFRQAFVGITHAFIFRLGLCILGTGQETTQHMSLQTQLQEHVALDRTSWSIENVYNRLL